MTDSKSQKKFITKEGVDALQAGHEIWDSSSKGLSGFHVKAGKTSKTFWLKTRIHGRQRLVKIGRADTWSAKDARQQAQEHRRDIDKGIDPTHAPAVNRMAPTVREIAEEWMAMIRAEKSESTALTYGKMLERFILPRIGAMKPREVTETEMKRMHRALSATPTQANLSVRVASALFSWAEDSERGYRDYNTNPCGPVKRNKERQRHHVFEEDALERFARVLAEMKAEGINPYALAAIEIAALTGCRRSDILGAKWAGVTRFEVDGRPAGKIALEKRKSGGIPNIHLSEEGLAIIDALPIQENNPYLICGFKPGRNLSPSYFGGVWTKLRERANLTTEHDDRWVTLHDLRHNYGGAAHASGETLADIGRQMGHRSLRMTERYVTTAEKGVRHSSQRVGNQIAEALRIGAADEPTEPPARSADVVPLRKRA